eukprot:4132571-Pleurochrysis_carterae.AAC.1
MAATGSGRKRDLRAKASRWMRCRAWRAKPPKTSRISGLTTCRRRSASWYFACWNVGAEWTSLSGNGFVCDRCSELRFSGRHEKARSPSLFNYPLSITTIWAFIVGLSVDVFPSMPPPEMRQRLVGLEKPVPE